MKPGQDRIDAFVDMRRRRGDRSRVLELARHVAERFYRWWSETAHPSVKLDAPLLDAHRQWLSELGDFAISTQYTQLASLRTFFRFLAAEGTQPHDVSKLLLLPRPPRGIRHVLSERDLIGLCEAVKHRDPTSLRDRGFLEILVATAMRPDEAARLRVDDLKLRQRRVRIRRGKGDRLRWLPLTLAAVRAVRRYLKVRRRLLGRGVKSDALFASRSGHLRKKAWLRVVARAATAADLEGRVTPYTIRHSVATALVRAGVELRHLQALLGHEHTSTTEIYLHLGPQDLKRAHARAHPRERNPRDPRGKRRG